MKFDLLGAYKSMLTIRMFENLAYALRLDGTIKCSVHLANGHEAIAVGTCHALQDPDVVFATYRGHHWAIACGVPLDALFAEFMGRESGLNGGRGGAGLFLAPQYGFLGENGIVGGNTPIAVGAALATRFDGSSRVAISAFGDGALNQGAVHEAMSFASLYQLPVIFLCENNGYAEYTKTDSMFRIPELSERARAYGFPGERVDGGDPHAVFVTLQAAIDRARSGGGPTMVEARVYRLEGHHTHDPEHYRSRDEKQAWREFDPLARTRSLLIETGVDNKVCDLLARDVTDVVAAAAEKAREEPEADANTVFGHLYA
jgi:TPP-dependent pyruvate/acetoin dehydrogenase alpha subunit